MKAMFRSWFNTQVFRYHTLALQLTNDYYTGCCTDIPGQENTAVLSRITPLNWINLQAVVAKLAVPGGCGMERWAVIDLCSSQTSTNIGPPFKVAAVLLVNFTIELYAGSR